MVRLAVMLGVGGGAAAVLFAIVMNLTAEPMGLLYSNLDLKEAGTITQALDQAGVKYEVKGDGSTIMVARDHVASARLMLAGKGLPTASSVGYEIFDTQNALGQTDFVQQLNMKRATEGELARTIRALDGVTFASVHLVLPERQLFQDSADQATASVTIGVGAREPSTDQVRAVQNLVAGAVPNLKPERVTVIDQHGKTLSADNDGTLGGKAGADAKAAIEDAVQARIKNLVEGIVVPARPGSRSAPTSTWRRLPPSRRSTILTARWCARSKPATTRPRRTRAAACNSGRDLGVGQHPRRPAAPRAGRRFERQRDRWQRVDYQLRDFEDRHDPGAAARYGEAAVRGRGGRWCHGARQGRQARRLHPSHGRGDAAPQRPGEGRDGLFQRPRRYGPGGQRALPRRRGRRGRQRRQPADRVRQERHHALPSSWASSASSRC